MKKLPGNNFRKIIISLILVLFGFSLQAFNGYRIEKRHYRKGYYVHICHAPKTKPVYQVAENPSVKDAPVKEDVPVKQTKPSTDVAPSSEPTRSSEPTQSSEPPPSSAQPQQQRVEEITPVINGDDGGRSIAPPSRVTNAPRAINAPKN